MIGAAVIAALTIAGLCLLARSALRLAILLLKLCFVLYRMFVIVIQGNDYVGGIAGASALLICAYVVTR
ncbi:hypothetical protein HAP48_0035100 [Bradyrhizobium septentrionale]|uniref:Uncharacterized protein n=1 Tax=Bradyrhizobium septentrionale TaxID=1404411 RepID=A0A974A265_9BRAD|nr:hypothetical protein [Bradyrhizobium septentrionale]UGY13762.1 hypothetical protein HAP48_0035100 [Bradyrhizobium septentrionale]